MRVIARAYEDRPLNRVLTGRAFGLAYIANPSADISTESHPAGVGFPSDSVFEFDGALLSRLESAWGAGDETALRALWGEAKPLQR